MGCHELVYANRHLSGIDIQTEMFEHSLFFVLDFDYFVFDPVHRFLRFARNDNSVRDDSRRLFGEFGDFAFVSRKPDGYSGTHRERAAGNGWTLLVDHGIQGIAIGLYLLIEIQLPDIQ